MKPRFDKSCRELPISDGDLILNMTKRLEANQHAVLLGFERSNINGEAVHYIGPGQSLVSLVDLLASVSVPILIAVDPLLVRRQILTTDTNNKNSP